MKQFDEFPWSAERVDASFRRTRLTFATVHGLFSSRRLDVGTVGLLRALDQTDILDGTANILDLGCGIGVLGIALQRALGPRVCTTLVDRDRLAVAASRLNARANDLDPDGDRLRVCAAGLGYRACGLASRAPFDLVVTNVPAKVGTEGLRELLFGAGRLLRPGGVLACVHVTPLTATIDALRAAQQQQNPIDTVLEKLSSGFRVVFWRFPEGLPDRGAREPEDALAAWRRPGRAEVVIPGIGHVRVAAVHDVPEFDTEHYRTPLLDALSTRARPLQPAESVLVFNPDHGLLAARVLHRRAPARLHLIGRDTLALEAARQTLAGVVAATGATSVHIAEAAARADLPWLPEPEPTYHLVVGHVDWEEGPRALQCTLDALAAALRDDGLMVLAVDTGRLKRFRQLAEAVGLRCGADDRSHGHAALVIRRAAPARE